RGCASRVATRRPTGPRARRSAACAPTSRRVPPTAGLVETSTSGAPTPAPAVDLESGEAGLPQRCDHRRPDAPGAMPRLVLGDRPRVIGEIEGEDEALHAADSPALRVSRRTLSANPSTTAKHTSGTAIDPLMPATPASAPIAGVNTAPPTIAMTSTDEASLRTSPRPLTPSAKIVGYMTDMKKLLAMSA